MRALAHGDDTDFVAVLLAEQRPGAGILGLVRGHDSGHDRVVLADIAVGLGLDRGNFLRRHGLLMSEVEAQPIRRHQAAPLSNVVAESTAQGLVQQVGRRMIGAD